MFTQPIQAVYNMYQIEKTAKFLFENNKSFCENIGAKKPEYIEKYIIDHINEFVQYTSEDIPWSATGGYILIPRRIKKNVIQVSVFVNLAIGILPTPKEPEGNLHGL